MTLYRNVELESQGSMCLIPDLTGTNVTLMSATERGHRLTPQTYVSHLGRCDSLNMSNFVKLIKVITLVRLMWNSNLSRSAYYGHAPLTRWPYARIWRMYKKPLLQSIKEATKEFQGSHWQKIVIYPYVYYYSVCA